MAVSKKAHEMYQDFFEGEKKKKHQYAYKCYTNFSEK